MAKIKLVVSATIEETFSDFIISKKTKGLAEKTLQSYQSQFQAVARHMDVKMDIATLQKADLDAMIISMWVAENESAKFWATVLNSLKNRGVEDIFIACTDNLTGFSSAIEAVFPKTEVQNCVMWQGRNGAARST